MVKMGEMRAEVIGDEEEALEPNPNKVPLPNQDEAPAETPEPETSSCVACDRPDSWDDMIMCDGPHEEQWYHLRCVAIQRLPSNGTKAVLGLTQYFLLT